MAEYLDMATVGVVTAYDRFRKLVVVSCQIWVARVASVDPGLTAPFLP